jgi:hypothetical protein
MTGIRSKSLKHRDLALAYNRRGLASFVKKTELEVKTMSESSARKAAEGFCKSVNEIKKTTSTGNRVYYLYEADCDKK